MTDKTTGDPLRCNRCGREAAAEDKFCAECGMFLRDAFVDQRLLLALLHEQQGRSRESRREIERLLEEDPNKVRAVGARRGVEWSLDQAGTDGIGSDSVFAKFGGQRLGEAQHTMLRRRVGR